MNTVEALIVYDVNTMSAEGRRRLRRVARVCEGHGQRVQASVFEVVVSAAEWENLQGKLNTIIDPDKDSLRYYRVPAGTLQSCVSVARNADILGHRDAWIL